MTTRSIAKRVPVLIVAAFVWLWPIGASAASNDQVIAQQKALNAAAETQANLLNDIARCQLAAANLIAVPGNLSNCAATLSGASATVRYNTSPAPTTPASPVVSSACTVSGTMTSVQMAVLNDYLIAKAKAEGMGMRAPAPTAEVAGLLAC